MGSSAPRSISFAIAGPIAQADLPGLCARVCRLLENGVEVVLCDVAGVAADAVSVDALARLRLAARRHGCQIVLHHSSSELRRLVALIGLSDVLPG